MAIPNQGYPSQHAAIVALRAEGLTPLETARAVGSTVSKVNRATRRELARGAGTPRLARDVVDRLAPVALRRGTSVSVLAGQLLAAIARDGLIEAVLDDARRGRR